MRTHTGKLEPESHHEGVMGATK